MSLSSRGDSFARLKHAVKLRVQKQNSRLLDFLGSCTRFWIAILLGGGGGGISKASKCLTKVFHVLRHPETPPLR